MLYGIGRIGYWLGYRIVGYRRTVVVDNLRRAFPEWTDARVREQTRAFYRYFFDSLAESIKLFSIGPEEVCRRCRLENPELVARFAQEGRSIIALGGHYGGWELAALSLNLQFPHQTVMGIYSPLKNETLDALIKANRGRTGTVLVSRRKVKAYFLADPACPAVDFFVADQSPSNAAWWKLHWTSFLQQTTSFLAGPERYAVRFDRPVYYLTLRLERRGYYVARLHRITDTPRETAPGFITEQYVRRLEKEILRNPTPWLWTHRRWKRAVAPEAQAALGQQAFLPPQYDRSRPKKVAEGGGAQVRGEGRGRDVARPDR